MKINFVIPFTSLEIFFATTGVNKYTNKILTNLSVNNTKIKSVEFLGTFIMMFADLFF